ncbi:MAG: TRAP transporter large permease subunit [Gammaproteobacteria bacterium]|jgi:tripartite ATP-independent transporter DctM subunit|nr:TRAP transporter large permease subunit [Gammaproteobacteria bacterium]
MIAALIPVLILLAVLGLPLFVVLGAGALIASRAGGMDPAILIIELNRISSSPNLIAIPLFTFAGVVLSQGGSPHRLIRFFNAALGWLPGGLGSVALTVCAFFTAFSGASGVTILALGGMLYPMLREAGYGELFTCGLLTSSGSLGILFAPSLAILVYGIVAGVNIDELFLSAWVPGIILLFMLYAYSLYSGTRFHLPHQAFEWKQIWPAFRGSFLDLLLPFGIIAGIFGGFVTVGEISACTAAYVLILEVAIYRTVNLRRQFIRLVNETAILVGSLLIILGIAMGLTNLLIDAQIPMRLLSWVELNVGDQLQFLLLLNVFLLMVGAMMDIFSAVIVVTPLILPIALHFGVDPVHLGVIVLANLEIGYTTPPVGINLFIASQRFSKPVLTLFRASVPFLTIMLVWLLIVTYLPQVSLWWRDLSD